MTCAMAPGKFRGVTIIIKRQPPVLLPWLRQAAYFNLFGIMKKFDLDKALAGHPVVTRDGKMVTNIELSTGSQSYITGRICGSLQKWNEDGRFLGTLLHDNDLLMAEPSFGESILVWDNKDTASDTKLEMDFVCFTTEGHVVATEDISNISIREPFAEVMMWEYWSFIEKPPQIEINAKINGREVKLSEISEETLLKLRNND